jgi:hypothetical protein
MVQEQKPGQRRDERASEARVVIQINVPGDNNVIHVSGAGVEVVGERRRRSRGLPKRPWAKLWTSLVKMADRATVAGHCISAAAITLLGPLGGA